jgi:hypothetical protein
MLKSKNYLDWMSDLGARLNLRDVSTQFVSVAIATNSLVESICEMANKEVSESPISMFSIVPCQTLEISVSHFDPTRLPSITQHAVPRQYRLDQGMTDGRSTRPARVSHRQSNPDHRTLHDLVWQTIPRILHRQRNPSDLHRKCLDRGGSVKISKADSGPREERRHAGTMVSGAVGIDLQVQVRMSAGDEEALRARPEIGREEMPDGEGARRRRQSERLSLAGGLGLHFSPVHRPRDFAPSFVWTSPR